MMRKLIILLLMLPFLVLWLELHVLVNNLPLNLEIPLDFIISMSLTFCSLIFSKIVLDLLYTLKDLYKKRGLITIFPFIFIKRKKVNVRFSPYFSFHLKSLMPDDLKSIQKSELSYSDLMCILLYDAINQSTFLTDSEVFEDILKKIEDSQNTLLCTGLAELLLYEITISNNNNWQEKIDKIRIRLIRINQLDFFYYTSCLRQNFDFCLISEFAMMNSRRILIIIKKLI